MCCSKPTGNMGCKESIKHKIKTRFLKIAVFKLCKKFLTVILPFLFETSAPIGARK